MMGLGLRGSVLAVVVLVDGEGEDRPPGWVQLHGGRQSGKALRARRPGVVLGLHTWHDTDHQSMKGIIETHINMWTRRFPNDIVMVVEVLP